jgi:hypothetical protein
MECVKCGSLRMMEFMDGFGQRRVFCKGCWGSFIDVSFVDLDGQKNLKDFSLDIYYNPQAVVRHFR